MELHFVITMASVSLLDAKLSFNVILCIFFAYYLKSLLSLDFEKQLGLDSSQEAGG